jgi:hypothetical protein
MGKSSMKNVNSRCTKKNSFRGTRLRSDFQSKVRFHPHHSGNMYKYRGAYLFNRNIVHVFEMDNR